MNDKEMQGDAGEENNGRGDLVLTVECQLLKPRILTACHQGRLEVRST